MEIHLPLPPSTNALFKTLRTGRKAKTQAYSAWLDEAGYHIRMAARGSAPLVPPLRMTIHAGIGRHRDISNIVKPIEDALVKFVPGLPDDRYNDDVRVQRDPTIADNTAIVVIESIVPG